MQYARGPNEQRRLLTSTTAWDDARRGLDNTRSRWMSSVAAVVKTRQRYGRGVVLVGLPNELLMRLAYRIAS